jgi:hypothetical protein
MHRKLQLAQRQALDRIPATVKNRVDLEFWHFLDPDSRSPVYCHKHQYWGFASLNELIDEHVGCSQCDSAKAVA